MGKRGPKPKKGKPLWTSELAYAVGLIATDGCLYNDGRHIALVSKDTQQLQNLKKCLGLRVKVGMHHGRKGISSDMNRRVQWGDITFYNFLQDIGVTPKKSLTLGKILVPDELFFDFLRGSFDGDGCFYSYFDPRWKSSFMFYLTFSSASRAHIAWLQKSLYRLADVSGHISISRPRKKREAGMQSLRYAKREALLVLRRMYHEHSSVCLTRKRLKIEKALRIVGLSLSDKR